jgi:hypothetical protein
LINLWISGSVSKKMKLKRAAAMHLFASTAAVASPRLASAFTFRQLSNGGRNYAARSSLIGKNMNFHQATVPSFKSQVNDLVQTRRFMATLVEETKQVAKEEVEELPTNESDMDLLKLRHSSAHVMAMAVQQVFPEAQTTIGPWIDNGFYYDFFFPETTDEETGETIPSRKLSDVDLKKIKKAMDKIVKKDYPITQEEVSREEAKKRIEEIGEPFKIEILDSIKTEPITIYHIGGLIFQYASFNNSRALHFFLAAWPVIGIWVTSI